jgi:Uma2 family endonuclease
MAAPTITPPDFDTVAKLVDHLGVPGERIRLRPAPGTARIEDAIEAERQGQLCELIDGVLVEKAVGYYESILAMIVGGRLGHFLTENGKPGFLLGESGMVWVEPGQMRVGNIAYVSWSHFPGRKLPRGAVLDLTPDWIIEVLSPSNTAAAMERKRREYFTGGAKLVWQVYPQKRSVEVYTAADVCTTHDEDAMLDGSPVLPAFQVSVREWFADAGE